jgi:hypothetical protein
MKFFNAVLLLCVLLIPAVTASAWQAQVVLPAQPAPPLPPNAPTRQQIMSLFEAIQLRRTMEAAQQAAMQNVVNMAQQLFTQGGRTLDAETKRQMDLLMNGVLEDVRAVLPTEAMLEAVIPIYQRHFTTEEVAAIIAFQSSPVGKKMIGLQPAMIQETVEALTPLQQRAMPELTRRLNDRLQKLMQAAPGAPGTVPAVPKD